jgi:hypothetical protein
LEEITDFRGMEWDNTPLFVKYNPGLLDLLDLFVLDRFLNE